MNLQGKSVEELRKYVALLEAREAALLKTIAFYVQEMERIALERANPNAVSEAA